MTGCTMALASSSSARSFPRNRSRKFTLSNDENERILRQSKQIDPKVAWRWPSTPADYGKQSTICSITLYFGSWGTRISKFHCRSCSTRGAIGAQSLHPNRTRLTKLTVWINIVYVSSLMDTIQCGANAWRSRSNRSTAHFHIASSWTSVNDL